MTAPGTATARRDLARPPQWSPSFRYCIYAVMLLLWPVTACVANTSCGALPSAYAVAAGTLTIGSGPEINGNSFTPSNGSNKAVNPPTNSVISPSPWVGFPALSPASFPSNSSTTNTSATTIAAGSYNTITISNDTTFSGGTYYIKTLNVGTKRITLATGNYYIETLTFGTGGRLLLGASATASIHIGSSVGSSTSDDVRLNDGGTAARLQFYLYSGATFRLDYRPRISAVIYGPASTNVVALGNEAEVTGAILTAGSVTLGSDVRLTNSASDRSSIGALSTCGTATTVAAFTVAVSSPASTCTAASVSITARDAANNVLTSYAGTVNLTTSSSHGDWAMSAANGSLTNGTVDDGAASYTFATTDQGVITLSLTNKHADTLTVSVVDSGLSASASTSASVNFLTNAFVITTTDSSGNTVVVGRDHSFQVALWQQDATTGNCAVATGYQGAKSLDAWITRNASDPGGTAPSIGALSLPNAAPASGTNNLTLSFTNGTSGFTLSTSDVGKYQLNLRDDSRSFAASVDISAASGTLTVRPFALHLSAVTASGPVNNPANNTATGGVFTQAGSNFSASVRGVMWEAADDVNNDGTADTGANLADNAVASRFAGDTTLSATAPYTPAGGVLGTLNNPTLASASYASGQASASTLQYTEVGSFTLNAQTSNYLDTAGVSVIGSAGVVGRFTPASFAVTMNTPVFNVGCSPGGFTYVGMPFNYRTAPVMTVVARNALGATTRNYTGSFWRITNASLTNRTYAALTGTLDLGVLPTIDPVIVDNGNGTGTLSFGSGSGIAFNRSTPTSPFTAEIRLSINVLDTDGVAYAGNPASFGSLSNGGGMAFDDANAATTNDKQVYWGRMVLENAAGSELLPLTGKAQVQYYDNGYFVTNNSDACTPLALSNLNVSNSVETPAQGSNSIRIAPSGTSSISVTATPFSAGVSGLAFSAPGAGNVGYALLSYDLVQAGLSWLQYDWTGIGTHNQSPSGRIDFGIYGQKSPIIYVREPWD